jgi:hypothetical protein
MRQVETVSAPSSPQISALAAYWETKRGDRFAPRRADIDPAEIREHMPRLFMIDVLPRGEYRYRLVGTELVERTGRDPTGKTLSQLQAERPGAHDERKHRYDQVVATRRPIFSRGEVYWLGDDEYRRFECGHFPLSDDGKTVNIILAELYLYWPQPG